MLVSRRINILKLSNRFLSSSSSSQSLPGIEELEIVTNPSGKHLDEFMKAAGNDRTVFKREDIELWQNSLKDYQLKVTCLKETKRVIATLHFCKMHPVPNSGNEPIVFMGFGWADPEYRSAPYIKFQNDMSHQMIPDKRTNVMAQYNEAARKWWHLLSGKTDHPEKGHEVVDVGYRSIYDAKEFVLPESLDTTGISVKNAREVPKKDIIEYDQTVHPYRREKYIISHMYDRDGYGKVAYDEDGKVIGIGQAIIYDNKKDCNLGPIYANEPRVAQAMFYEMLKDIKDSGKFVSQFEVRTTQKSANSFHWIAPFLKCKPTRTHICNLVYTHWVPKNIGFEKIYCPTHLQTFIC
ncbi:hypothetical protein CRE_06672 [Caenorhabditis remanei]|uniref:DUF1248 domain-containing protein n=1 Tax=Caenorhabditis remanei TaxID=31234 RepID=E3M0V2_CAERE|nr:hypothetical protein CRE_06672 [Caenorhabditis remanei]